MGFWKKRVICFQVAGNSPDFSVLLIPNSTPLLQSTSLYDLNPFKCIQTSFMAEPGVCPNQFSVCTWAECMFFVDGGMFS